jgi:hypothetical protein
VQKRSYNEGSGCCGPGKRKYGKVYDRVNMDENLNACGKGWVESQKMGLVFKNLKQQSQNNEA